MLFIWVDAPFWRFELLGWSFLLTFYYCAILLHCRSVACWVGDPLFKFWLLWSCPSLKELNTVLLTIPFGICLCGGVNFFVGISYGSRLLIVYYLILSWLLGWSFLYIYSIVDFCVVDPFKLKCFFNCVKVIFGFCCVATVCHF